MKLHPFRITINRRPPFFALFPSSAAVLDAFEPIAFAEAEQFGGFKLTVVALRPTRIH